jgi:hypothetical protein
MSQKHDTDSYVLIATGILIGAGLIYLIMRKLNPLQFSLQPTTIAPLSQATRTHQEDTEFIKWYTETITKPTIIQSARDATEKAIKQFIDENHIAADIQTVGIGTTKQKYNKAAGVAWIVNRDADGAIAGIDTIKTTKSIDKNTNNTNIRGDSIDHIRTTQGRK